MRMSRFEKLFVNRPSKGRMNIQTVEQRLADLDTGRLRHALEIGCGIGSVSAWLASHYDISVDGTDVDPEQIAEAQARYAQSRRLTFRVEDASRLSYADDSFDMVIAHNTFHHIPAWEKAIDEVARVLRPNGHFLWLDIVFADPLRSTLQRLAPNESFFTIHEVMYQLTLAGFRLCSHQHKPRLLLTQHDLWLERTPVNGAVAR